MSRTMPRLFWLQLLIVLGANVRAADLPWADAQQMVVVTTADWDVNHGLMQTFEREGAGWKAVSSRQPITVGRSGSAWGLGLHTVSAPGPVKQEGDGRSPAGVFRIGLAFGYAPGESTALRYQGMTGSDYCIDVSNSSSYNRIVDAKVVGQSVIEGSTEPMRRDLHANGDQRYKLGFVIGHNDAAVAARGSCIFAHLWKQPGEPTAGCTAMSEDAMRDLFSWLRADGQPVFVLLPQSEYERLKEAWQLP
jgi:L,D-peptidoglycan transpeptidase YkuD (ErfK/YbiS/YcfS/YnhG family)